MWARHHRSLAVRGVVADVIVAAAPGALKQLVQTYEALGGNVIGVEVVLKTEATNKVLSTRSTVTVGVST